jgi:DNA-directed RNA polymerase specialized sigma subunit
MTIKREFEAVAQKEDKYWEIRIDELDQVIQARRVGDVEDMATYLAAGTAGLEPEEVKVNVTFRGPDAAMQRWAQARQDIERGQELSSKGAAESRAVVLDLSEKFSITEVARMLGVSTQRISQLKAKKS